MPNSPQTTSDGSDAITLEEIKATIDTYLNGFYAERIAEAAKLSPHYERLWKITGQLSRSGGKRLRPYILLSAYQAFTHKSDISAILPAAVAQELIHFAVLIHDDIIDRDDIRYGVKNVTGAYLDEYKDLLPDDAERRHFANSAALLVADALISQAHLMLQRCEVDTETISKVQQVFSESIFNVVGGELIDTESAFRPFHDSNALTVARHKTASYSFIGPLVMGAHFAAADDAFIQSLRMFGDDLGIAFQLADDLLGTFGDEAVTGKSSSGDIKEAKHTFLIEKFHQVASDEQKAEFEQYFGLASLSDDELARARTLLIDSGAREAVQSAIQTHVASARERLEALQFDEQYDANFQNLIDMCVNRSK